MFSDLAFPGRKALPSIIADKGGRLKVFSGNSEGRVDKSWALVDFAKFVLALWPFESHLLIIESNSGVV